MALGTPYLIAAAVSGTPSSSAAFAVTGPSGQGDMIVAGIGSSQSGATVLSVTDTQGNAYAAVNDAQSGPAPAAQWTAFNAAPLGLTDTIKIAMSAPGLIGTVVAGVPGAGGTDQAVSAAAPSGATPSVTSGFPLAQGTEMALMLLVNGNAGGTPFSLGSGFVSLATVSAAGSEYVTAAYLPVSGTGAVTASASISSADWSALLLTLTPAADPAQVDWTQFPVPSAFTAPTPGGYLYLPDFYAAGQPLAPPGSQDPASADFSSLFPPGPFISPGANPASAGLYQADFYDGGQPLPLTPADQSASDSSALLAPGPFISPAGPALHLVLPDFVSGSPQPLPITAPDQSASDASVLLSPGPFTGPGPNQASNDLYAPDFYDGGQPAAIAPHGTQDGVAVLVPPGLFISPGGQFFWQPDGIPVPAPLAAGQQGAFMTFMW